MINRTDINYIFHRERFSMIPTLKHKPYRLQRTLPIFLTLSLCFNNYMKASPRLDLSVSLPFFCLCANANIGLLFEGKQTVGLNFYSGGLPFAGGGTLKAIFYRAHPWENSFFLNARIGYMETTWSRPNGLSESGASLGLDIGNRWFYDSGFTQGITWMGTDIYLKKTEVAGLPHGLRYELGWVF